MLQLQHHRVRRAGVALAVVLLLAGCAGTPSGAKVVGMWGSTASGQPNLNIENDGTFSGSDGCNRLSGQGQIDGDEITFGSIASTMMACQGVDTWLSKAATGNVKGDTMTVLDDGGKTIGTLPRSGS
jgi:heat shock protein HslJ